MIFTIKGQEVLLDNCDADVLGLTQGGCYSGWCLNRSGYMKANLSGKFVDMHKIIQQRMGFEGFCDHINGNKLDNRRCNLRPATRSQNGANRDKLSNNKSGYKGASPERGKWKAQIKHNGKVIYLGLYKTPKEAHEAYKAAANELHGAYAKY